MFRLFDRSASPAVRVTELSGIVSYMQNLAFTTHYPPDDYPGDVYIAAIDAVLRWPPGCRTMYVTCDMELEELHMATAWMPKGLLVVTVKLSS